MDSANKATLVFAAFCFIMEFFLLFFSCLSRSAWYRRRHGEAIELETIDTNIEFNNNPDIYDDARLSTIAEADDDTIRVIRPPEAVIRARQQQAPRPVASMSLSTDPYETRSIYRRMELQERRREFYRDLERRERRERAELVRMLANTILDDDEPLSVYDRPNAHYRILLSRRRMESRRSYDPSDETAPVVE